MQLIDEINALEIRGMPRLEKLNALVGSYVNLAYPLPSGLSVKFLDDQTTYLGTQLESEIVEGLCFGRRGPLLRRAGKHGIHSDLHLRRKRR